MSHSELHVVTGAFGYSGRYIAQRLLRANVRVRTLTGSAKRKSALEREIEVHPLDFDDPTRLAASLEGARVLYNTYWVRFNHDDFNHGQAVRNTLRLFEAAQSAGVERVVHVSITNPDPSSSLEYFRGKGELEAALTASKLSYAILRPAVLFGGEDILINNIAWAVRHFPVFGVFGKGDYRLQPIHVDDFAKLAVELGQSQENTIVDAIGPETYTYRELVRLIVDALQRSRWIVSIPPSLGYLLGVVIGKIKGDIMITRPEIEGLMAGLLATDSPPAGTTKLSDWVRENRATLGRKYSSELARRRDLKTAYAEL